MGFFDRHDVLRRRFLHVKLQECHALGEKCITVLTVLELDGLTILVGLPGIQEGLLNGPSGTG